MDKTFTLRRKGILEKSPDLNSLFKEYPFLQDSNQVFHYVIGVYGTEVSYVFVYMIL